MRHTISKTYHFSASHTLHGLSDNHPCSRLHGHNYTVEVALSSTNGLGPRGMLVDYRDLDATIGHWIDEQFDHRDLNERLPKINPTAEHLAQFIFEWSVNHWWWAGSYLLSITVCETERTKATYG